MRTDAAGHATMQSRQRARCWRTAAGLQQPLLSSHVRLPPLLQLLQLLLLLAACVSAPVMSVRGAFRTARGIPAAAPKSAAAIGSPEPAPQRAMPVPEQVKTR